MIRHTSTEAATIDSVTIVRSHSPTMPISVNDTAAKAPMRHPATRQAKRPPGR
jgi:hypothetical protein